MVRIAKIGPNERCLCGSGKKHKKCCGDRRAATLYTARERASALLRLDEWLGRFAEDEIEEAAEVLWGPFRGRIRELPDELAMVSRAVVQAWAAFDYIGDRGVPLAEAFLAEAELGGGERAFLTALCRSAMRLYEVVGAAPGSSLTLRDVLDGGLITVNERAASRALARRAQVAARIVPCGASGGPELEAGLLRIPRLVQDEVAALLRAQRARFLRERPGASADAFYKQTPPLFHDAWVGALLEPHVPELTTNDGESFVPTITRFDVLAADLLVRALDGAPELGRASQREAWEWFGASREGKRIRLGRVERRGDVLILGTLSIERAARGRALLEALAGDALRHRGTTHVDLRPTLESHLQDRAWPLYKGGDSPR